MLISNADITSRYNTALQSITNITYNRYGRDLYGVLYRKLKTGEKLELLLEALTAWNNRPGAVNPFSAYQMFALMEQIIKVAAQDEDSDTITSVDAAAITGANSGGASFTVLDTSSIDLSYSNNKLSATLRVSSTADNRATINSDGLYVSSSASTITKLLTGNSFNTGTNVYQDSSLAGKKVLVWHRGLGYLLYNANNPSDPTNEISILSDGGFTITIPGFDVHDGTNYFYITVTDYE